MIWDNSYQFQWLLSSSKEVCELWVSDRLYNHKCPKKDTRKTPLLHFLTKQLQCYRLLLMIFRVCLFAALVCWTHWPHSPCCFAKETIQPCGNLSVGFFPQHSLILLPFKGSSLTLPLHCCCGWGVLSVSATLACLCLRPSGSSWQRDFSSHQHGILQENLRNKLDSYKVSRKAGCNTPPVSGS